MVIEREEYFAEDYAEDDYAMTVGGGVVECFDLSTKSIYLADNTVDGSMSYHPTDDIYPEMRTFRLLDSTLRVLDVFLEAQGNVYKGTDEEGAAKYTGRLTIFKHGWRIVPFNVSHILNVTGEQITDDGQSGAAIMDLTSLTHPVIINYAPPTTEIIRDEKALEAIGHIAFNGGVTYDAEHGFEGTGVNYLGDDIGTPKTPSSNIYDSRTIGHTRGLTKGYINGDLDFPMYELDGTTPFEINNFDLQGSGQETTTVTIPDIANIVDCKYSYAKITGYVDGITKMYECLMEDVTGLNGKFKECMLNAGRLTLTNGISHFIDCDSGVPGLNSPIVDYNVTGASAAFRGFKGGTLHTNKTGPDAVSIDLVSGQIKIDLYGNFGDNGVTGGTFVCRGVGKVVEATTGAYLPSGDYGGLNLLNETVGLDSFSVGKYIGRIYIDAVDGEPGTTDPVGLITDPVNNMIDAFVLSGKYYAEELHYHSDFVFTSGTDLRHYKLSSHDHLLTFESGVTTDYTAFTHAKITGIMTGAQEYNFCNLNDMYGLGGHITSCTVGGDLTFGSDAVLKEVIANVPTIIRPNGHKILVPKIQGYVTIKDMTSGSVGIAPTSGVLTIDPSCTGGTITINSIGTAVINQNQNGTVVILNELTTSAIADAVASVDPADYHDTDTFAGGMSHLKHLQYRICVDSTSPPGGDGSQHHPFNVQADALDYAEAHNIKYLDVNSNMDIARNLKNFIVTGVGVPVLTFQVGTDLKGSKFVCLCLSGSYTDSITAQDCILRDVVINGNFETCATNGVLTVPPGGTAYMTKCTPIETEFERPTYDIGGEFGTGFLQLMGYKGGATIRYCNNLADVVKIVLDGGHIHIESTCTVDGTIVIIGEGTFTNDSDLIPDTARLINKESITKDIVTYNGIYHA